MVGAGAWGTTLGRLLAQKGERVRLLCHSAEQAALLERDRTNTRYLPGFSLPDGLHATADPGAALDGADLVLLVVPSHAFREALLGLCERLPPEALLVSATKGIENDTLMLMAEVIEDVAGKVARSRACFLSGPSFAREVAQGLPTNIVVASTDQERSVLARTRFATSHLRVYSSDDAAGVEVGGALKNVIAIAAGACDALGFGHNTRAALITRGLAEIARIAVRKGGNPLTLAGLAGMGDLVLTCTGELSRNRTVGFEMGKGRPLGEVLASLGHVAEGVRTSKSAHHLAERLGVELPICAEVYRVLYEGKPPLVAVEELLTRPLKKEWG